MLIFVLKWLLQAPEYYMTKSADDCIQPDFATKSKCNG